MDRHTEKDLQKARERLQLARNRLSILQTTASTSSAEARALEEEQLRKEIEDFEAQIMLLEGTSNAGSSSSSSSYSSSSSSTSLSSSSSSSSSSTLSSSSSSSSSSVTQYNFNVSSINLDSSTITANSPSNRIDDFRKRMAVLDQTLWSPSRYTDWNEGYTEPEEAEYQRKSIEKTYTEDFLDENLQEIIDCIKYRFIAMDFGVGKEGNFILEVYPTNENYAEEYKVEIKFSRKYENVSSKKKRKLQYDNMEITMTYRKGKYVPIAKNVIHSTINLYKEFLNLSEDDPQVPLYRRALGFADSYNSNYEEVVQSFIPIPQNIDINFYDREEKWVKATAEGVSFPKHKSKYFSSDYILVHQPTGLGFRAYDKFGDGNLFVQKFPVIWVKKEYRSLDQLDNGFYGQKREFYQFPLGVDFTKEAIKDMDPVVILLAGFDSFQESSGRIRRDEMMARIRQSTSSSSSSSSSSSNTSSSSASSSNTDEEEEEEDDI